MRCPKTYTTQEKDKITNITMKISKTKSNTKMIFAKASEPALSGSQDHHRENFRIGTKQETSKMIAKKTVY